jgi:hypothetical protein
MPIRHASPIVERPRLDLPRRFEDFEADAEDFAADAVALAAWESLLTPASPAEADDFAAFFEDYPRRTPLRTTRDRAGTPLDD